MSYYADFKEIFDDIDGDFRFFKKEADTMFRMIVSYLNLNIWEIVIDHKIKSAGKIDYAEKIILINPLWGDRIITLLHEVIEIMRPNWTEEKVEKEAVKCWKQMTPKQEDMLWDYLRR